MTKIALSWLLLASFAYSQALISSSTLLETVNKQIKHINTKDLKTLLAKQPDTFLIDVRNREDIDILGGEIRALNNYNIPRGWLETRIKDILSLKQDSPIVVYCGIGVRSAYATQTLQEMGYTNVRNYKGGFKEWNENSLPKRELDKNRESILYERPREVAEGIYSAIGATSPATYENSGHNNNLSFVITKKGVVVFNAGASYLLAKAIHEEIQSLTYEKVKYAIMENAQGHAANGMNYWQEQGVTTVMHKLAFDKWKATGESGMERARRVQRDKFLGTAFVHPDKVFDTKFDMSMGGEKIEALYLGKSHGPGDIVLHVPNKKLVISGDFAFNVRMLPVFADTSIIKWIENWDKFEALKAKYVIPGHGGATEMKTVKSYTVDYLQFLLTSVEYLLDNDMGLEDISKIDQSQWWHMDTFRELSLLNLSNAFKKLEFEL